MEDPVRGKRPARGALHPVRRQAAGYHPGTGLLVRGRCGRGKRLRVGNRRKRKCSEYREHPHGALRTLRSKLEEYGLSQDVTRLEVADTEQIAFLYQDRISNHDKLMRLISNTIKDGDVISLIRKFLVSGVMMDDEYKESVIGTPQGGNLSPLLSNIMLNELDQELEARGLNFVRYADDCLILVKSEKAAKRVMKSMTKYLEETLGLKVNVTKSKVERPSGIKFLGFGFFWDKNAYQFKAKPHQISIMRVKEKLKRLTRRSWSVSFDYRLKKLKQLIIGWVNYFKIAKMRTVCGNLDKNIRFRLRMCIWKQWKKVQTKYRSLMRLGIDKDKAWEWANTRKGYARVARSFILCRTITNERLKRRGLVSLLDHYQTVHI